MGWEVAINQTHNGEFKRYVFFCNTSDKAFGPVFYLSDCYDIGEFYKAWDELQLPEPRCLPSDLLWTYILHMKEHFGEDISEYLEE